jgi:hypothetical protein
MAMAFILSGRFQPLSLSGALVPVVRDLACEPV